ncbi:hypothetical protein ACFDR9_002818 [Janthinobacterium sp. CG_23.3]|uniref:hypothetical protein n=1 Tax=Janthinobacterium sp. CG_23.3 TaxID=3349634 RepID=UPI0038D43B37
MAQAKGDLARGLLTGVAIHVHSVVGHFHYGVHLQSCLSTDQTGPLVDARTSRAREFKTMDAAHSAVREVGFNIPLFLSGALL